MDGYYDVHLKHLVSELRFFSPGRSYAAGHRFEHIVNVVAEEDVAVIRGLRSYMTFFLSLEQRRLIARELKDAGFNRVAWDKYRPPLYAKHRAGPFDLATWLR